MSIHRNRWGFNGQITFECDECGKELHTDLEGFEEAKEMMRKEGWKNKKDKDGDWQNLCPKCC